MTEQQATERKPKERLWQWGVGSPLSWGMSTTQVATGQKAGNPMRFPLTQKAQQHHLHMSMGCRIGTDLLEMVLAPHDGLVHGLESWAAGRPLPGAVRGDHIVHDQHPLHLLLPSQACKNHGDSPAACTAFMGWEADGAVLVAAGSTECRTACTAVQCPAALMHMYITTRK